MWWSQKGRPATEGEEQVVRCLLSRFPSSDGVGLLIKQLRQGPLHRERTPDGYLLRITQTTDDLLIECEAEWRSPWATITSDAGAMRARASVTRGGFLGPLEIHGVRHTQWAVASIVLETGVPAEPSEPQHPASLAALAPPELRAMWPDAPVAGATYEIWPAADAYEADGALVFGTARVEEELLVWRAGLFATHTGTCAHDSLGELLACLDDRVC